MNNYVSTEKSLKSWLKTKVKVTMATVVGFLIAGNVVMGAETTEKINVDKETVIDIRTGGNSKDAIVGINANNGYNGENYKNDKNIDITYKEEIGDKWIAGIFANNGGKVEISSENININLSSESDKSLKGVVARNEGAVEGKAVGGKIILGGENTKDINIKVHSDNGFVSALEAHRRNGNIKDTSYLEVNSENLTIEASSNWRGEADDDGVVYAVFTQGTGGENDRNAAEIIINSKNTKITSIAGYNGNEEKFAHSFGLAAFSGSKIKVNGNLEIDADTVIVTRGYSTVIVNENNKNTIKLNGNIEFNYDESSSGTTVDAGILLNLSNKESFLNGKISITGNPESGKDQVNGMKLGLSNEGTWKVTGDSLVNDLTMNGGILEVTDDVKDINVDRLHGNKGTITFSAEMNEDSVKVTEGKLNIDEVKDNTSLEVGFSGINADDLAGKDLNKAFGELTDKVNITTGADKADETYFADRGVLTGKIIAEADENGNIVNIKQEKDTPITAAVRDLTAINYLSWKQEMSSLSQRMGELRDSSAEHGVWARVYGGKIENGSQYDNEYQTYQVGYDKKYTVDNGRVYLGYLVSYTDGETDYDYGTGENYSVGAGIYATWMNNNGHYVDVLYKVSRLNNKFDMKDVEDVKGDYDTYGISLSAEYGKRFDITEKWFAEPSIGMHLGRLREETYTTDSEIEVSQDSIYTAEGRIGTAVGYKFNDKGNVYVRTHVVKEFAGDVDTEYERNGVFASTSEDFGDTWFEFGVGVNYRFAESVNVYADIEKSGNATADTEWQGNLGFRYEF